MPEADRNDLRGDAPRARVVVRREAPAGRESERRQWQRRAAGTLVHLTRRHSILPAIQWAVTRDGRLAGWLPGVLSAQDAEPALNAWAARLELGTPGRAIDVGGAGLLLARGQWCSVPVTVAARITAEDRPLAQRWTGELDAWPWTSQTYRGARALSEVLEKVPAAPVITWQVEPDGALAGRVGRLATARESLVAVAEWRAELGLARPVGTGTGYSSRGSVYGVTCTISGHAAGTAPGRTPPDSPAPRQRIDRQAGLPPPGQPRRRWAGMVPRP
jgi:hypothetical protein